MGDKVSNDSGNHKTANKAFIEVKSDGIFLTVQQAVSDKNKVQAADIIKELKNLNVEEYDNKAIEHTLKEDTGVAVKIGNVKEPEVKVVVSRDKMEACLEITKSSNCREITYEEVMEKINKNGVAFGLQEDEIRRAIRLPGTQVSCAKGIAPINGEPASIKIDVDFENKGHPTEMKDGKVDFKNLNLFKIVKQGDLLAEKIPATKGTAGTDVLGRSVSPKPGKDIMLPLGKNVKADGNFKIYADSSGQFQLTNNRINVIPVIEVRGDVDLSTGNINFIGNVIVRGSVQPGFTVKANGDVEIAGTVSGGTVEGQNVIIKMGIQGMHSGYIKAKEKVTAKFIENAVVYAGNEIKVNDVILHSKINAGSRVIVEGRRGLIAGGEVSAGEEICAKVVGTHLAPSTTLEVGVNPMLREEYQRLRQNIKKTEYNLDQTQKGLHILKSMDQNTLSPEKRQLLLKLTKAQFHLAGQLEVMRKRNSQIDTAFEEMHCGRIKISDTVFPGVKIVIGTEVKLIRENLNFVTFYTEEGEIKISPFK